MDYLNEYCNFGCAYFVLQKTDMKAAISGTRATSRATIRLQAARRRKLPRRQLPHRDAQSGGMITRWPPKERQGHPVRMPGAAAVARAAEDAERRGLHAQSHGGGGHAADNRSAHNGRAAADAGHGTKGLIAAMQPIRNGARSMATTSAQADSRSGGQATSSNRSTRLSHHDRQSNPAKRGADGGKRMRTVHKTLPRRRDGRSEAGSRQKRRALARQKPQKKPLRLKAEPVGYKR